MSVETFLKWKILPRFMMLASTIMSWRCAEWFMDLDAPTASQSAFVSVASPPHLPAKQLIGIIASSIRT